MAGAHCWLERRLFEIVGGWVASTAEPSAKLLFDRHSEHHAWRAGQWLERLPLLAEVDTDGLIAAPSGPMAPALDRLAAMSTPVSRAAGLYRSLLPRVWSGYERHRSAAGALADGSSLRTLSIAIDDVKADWQEGEQVLQGLVTDRQAALEVATALGGLEEIFSSAEPC